MSEHNTNQNFDPSVIVSEDQEENSLWSDLGISKSKGNTVINQKHTIADILKSSNYGLDIFTEEEISKVRIFSKNGRPYLHDFVSHDKDRPATPEEIVRQLFIYRLINTYDYKPNRVELEKGVYFGSNMAEKRADIVISHKDDPNASYIIVEVKKPKRRDGLEQLKSYCNAEGAPIAVWTNGSEVVILHREDPNSYRNLSDIPNSRQTLAQIINEQITLDQLIKENKLVKERWTLKKIILDLENLVLANAGVDAFEEVFKLIYAKLYDEWKARRRAKRLIEFRAAGEDHQELFEKISKLFQEAKDKWPGVFLQGERIDLTPAHLAVCVSFLQDIALFNSNLQIIDEAFEYLVTQVAKGSKGQYFTPRHVIDMCVKMLNPKWDEYMIDTAAGSCGFTVHTIFWVWGGEMTSQGPSKEESEYATEMVYGLDFDSRSVKIAKALNLIAGDGRTHVYRVNTLDPRNWNNEAQVGLAPLLQKFPKDPIRSEWNEKNFRYFNFDVLMTNPPFAGDIKDSRILNQYELAKQWKSVDVDSLVNPDALEDYAKSPSRHDFQESGKWWAKQGRDVLFIERNLEFLRPGGRMAIILPQGRFNNITDSYVRWFINRHARILAVVGLHVNTFKPHTGTKTSVLFLQKWNEDPNVGPICKPKDNYPIFFATSQQGGKDNSGEYIYKIGSDGRPQLDSHGHLIVEHDLDEIANAFVSFAKDQNFTFRQED